MGPEPEGITGTLMTGTIATRIMGMTGTRMTGMICIYFTGMAGILFTGMIGDILTTIGITLRTVININIAMIAITLHIVISINIVMIAIISMAIPGKIFKIKSTTGPDRVVNTAGRKIPDQRWKTFSILLSFMKAKTVILDASSAILLCKSELHLTLTEVYDVAMSVSVYREITDNPYEGAAEYSKLEANQQVRVLGNAEFDKTAGISGLDAGERDTIQLYLAGMGDFVITDDGSAAKFCKKKGIPFINALLFPIVLLYSEKIDRKTCDSFIETIIKTGRYSKKVITFARQCTPKTIAFALPQATTSLANFEL